MFFDAQQLPTENGATSFGDSARLAGLMAIVGHANAPDLSNYLVTVDGKTMAVRHPKEFPSNYPNNFTRDQLIPLVAGLSSQKKYEEAAKLYYAAILRGFRAQNTEHDVPGSVKTFPNGADLLSPFHMLVLAKAANKNTFFWGILGYPNAAIDVIYNSIVTPTREPNQLISALYVLGPSWIKFYKYITPQWKDAIRNYWSGWRDESDFAEYLILVLDSI